MYLGGNLIFITYVKNSVSRWELFQKIDKRVGPNKAMSVGKKSPKNKKCNTLIRNFRVRLVENRYVTINHTGFTMQKLENWKRMNIML